jgi:hypothetical protein
MNPLSRFGPSEPDWPPRNVSLIDPSVEQPLVASDAASRTAARRRIPARRKPVAAWPGAAAWILLRPND